MLYPRQGGHSDVDALTAGTGVPVLTAPGVGLTLVPGTYYLPLGGNIDSPMPRETSMVSAHFMWSGGLVAVITFESCNFAQKKTADGGTTWTDDVSDFDNTTAGAWIQQMPPDAYVAVSPANAGTASLLSVTTIGANAGGAELAFNFAGRRGRFKVVVTTAGVLRDNHHGKLGA